MQKNFNSAVKQSSFEAKNHIAEQKNGSFGSKSCFSETLENNDAI